MLTVTHTEFLKLRNSLALLLCAAAPTMVAVLTSMVVLNREAPTPWPMFTSNLAAAWALFMMPMTVTALTVLLAQLEHGSRFWNHLLALPLPRWQVFGAKALVTVVLVAVMSLALIFMIPVAGNMVEAATGGEQLSGRPDFYADAARIGRMFQGALLLIVVQLWSALHFRSFVPPLVLGIGGTLVAIVASGAEEGVFFPWLMPANVLSPDPARADLAVSLGFWGGIAALIVMVVHLSRRAPA